MKISINFTKINADWIFEGWHLYTTRFGKKIKEVSELKGKVLIKFDDNTNDLVDIVVAADGIFSNTRSFFEKKKMSQNLKKL